jgi:hypothetical protein
MRYDLEDELLRAAAQLRGVFALSALRDELERVHARHAHPLLAHVVEGLVARLVDEGMVVVSGDGYVIAERAWAHLQREPSVLLVEDGRQGAAAADNDGGYALVERAVSYVQGDYGSSSERRR